MRTEIIEIFKYDELSPKAQERARESWARHAFEDSCDWEYVYEDAQTVGALMGIEIDDRSFKTCGGGTGKSPDIMFSGFWSQGDGACFNGSYRYAKGGVKAVKGYAGVDTELHSIAQGLQDVQKRHFYRLWASCKQRGHYSHSGCMDVSVSDSENEYRDLGDAEQDVRDLLRRFADWIYDQLEKEYDYRTSDDVVSEDISNNEMEFTEEGEPV